MVWEAAREGVHGDACGGGEQGGEDIEGGWVKKVLATVKEGGGGDMVVELALEATGRCVQNKVGA